MYFYNQILLVISIILCILYITLLLTNIRKLYKLYKRIKIQVYREKSKKLLQIFDKIMRKNNVPYIIFFGTLLGSIRENNFIDTDHDMDVIIFDKDLPKYLSLESQFNKEGLKYDYLDHIHRLFFKDDNITKNSTYMDVFVYKLDKNIFIDKYEYNRHRWPSCKYPKEDILPVKEYTIAGLNVLGPNNGIKILEITYGDWKTPRNSNYYVKKL